MTTDRNFHETAVSPRIASLLTRLQSKLQDAISAGVPGLSVVISSPSGRGWQLLAGNANLQTRESMNRHDVFGVGSITKVFVAIVIMQLVEAKRLNLSDTLGNLLPSHVLKDIDHASEATIRNLMSHTAGVDSWEDDPKWIREGRGEALDPDKIWAKQEPLDYVRRYNPNGPKPGTFSYSNSGYTLLGLVIERVTGKTAESEIRRRILDPLNMKETFLEGFEKPVGRMPHRYHWATETFRKTAGICLRFTEVRDDLIDATPSNLSVEWTAGGIVSSPADLVKFASAIRDGKLINQSSFDFMCEWQKVNDYSEMGHGLFRMTRNGRNWLGHFGAVLGFTGAMWWAEDGTCAVCVSANVGTMHSGQVPSSAYQIVRDEDIAFLKAAAELAACG